MRMDAFFSLPFPQRDRGSPGPTAKCFLSQVFEGTNMPWDVFYRARKRKQKTWYGQPAGAASAFPLACTALGKLFNLHLSHLPHFLLATLSSLQEKRVVSPAVPWPQLFSFKWAVSSLSWQTLGRLTLEEGNCRNRIGGTGTEKRFRPNWADSRAQCNSLL